VIARRELLVGIGALADLETDPIEAGWIKSLARPGGNLTGFFLDIPELSGKLLQFLAEAMPRLHRVAVLWDADLARPQLNATETAARTLKFQLQSLPVRHPGEFAGAFEQARQQRAQAVVIPSSPLIFQNLRRLGALAIEQRLPAISVFPQFAAATHVRSIAAASSGRDGEARTRPGMSRRAPTALSLWKWPPKPRW